MSEIDFSEGFRDAVTDFDREHTIESIILIGKDDGIRHIKLGFYKDDGTELQEN